MQDVSQSVMVALLPLEPVEWTQTDLPHMTLVYAGQIPDLRPTVFNELGKIAAVIGNGFAPVVTDVLATDILGDEELVDVLLLRPTQEILAMRAMLEPWDASMHRFKPHVTVGPAGSVKDHVPNQLIFDRCIVKWGKSESIVYNLKV